MLFTPKFIPVGTCVCPTCGRRFTDAVYREATSRTGAKLSKGIRGYHLEPWAPDGKPDPLEVNFDPKQVPKNEVPDYITFTTADQHQHQWYRVCPLCPNNVRIPHGVGNLPTYLIPVIGIRNQGKSCLLYQLACAGSIRSVNRSIDGFSLWPADIHTKIDRVPKEHNATAQTTSFVLREKSENGDPGKEVAVIIFQDLEGELFENDTAKEKNGIKGKPDIKARAVIRDALIQNSSALIFVSTPVANDGNLYKDHISDYLSHNQGPIAFVLAKFDMIAAGCFGEKYTTTKDNNGNVVTLLSPNTFPVDNGHGAYYAINTLRKRFALEKYIAEKDPFVGIFSATDDLNRNMRSVFLVKSCSEIDKDYLDYRNPVNAYDPILWILQKLGLLAL